MAEPSSSNAPRRRVGVYERLRGPAGGSPARMLGIGVVVLIILIVIILVLTSIGSPCEAHTEGGWNESISSRQGDGPAGGPGHH